MQRRTTTALVAVVAAVALIASSCSDGTTGSATDQSPPPTAAPDTGTDDEATGEAEATDEAEPTASAPADAAPSEDRAYYILPPGNFGGLPTTDDSLDQLPLYDALTPLRGDVGDDDIDASFLAFDFEPIGETAEEPTGRDGLRIVYDEYGVPHISGETRADLAFGAGWVTARDRGLLLDLGRGPARVAVADVPGIDAFSLVTSGQEFVPSEATEALVAAQVQLVIDTYGAEGEEIIADAQAYVDGVNAYKEANGGGGEPFTVNDVIATTAFIGSIFGAGGGAEAAIAEHLSLLIEALGPEQGRLVWEDIHRAIDAEAPTTIEERFDYGVLTGGEVTGSVIVDHGSIRPTDVLDAPDGSATDERDDEALGPLLYDPADGPPARRASNWLTIDPAASANATTLAVMGPQLGYYYPEIVQQIHFSGAGIEAQGAAVPGLAMYLLIGRTADYAWSLTSANQDVRDVYAEVLCEPDGSAPTVDSTHYEYDSDCVAFTEFDAGTLGGSPVRYPVSVHGPVIATATSEGRPIALASKRSTFGRDGLNLAALKGMTEGEAATPEAFFDTANRFGFTFNWGYANRSDIAYFASGRLPVRPAGLDRRLPTLGTGAYEWEGFLELDERPHAIGHPDGRLLNWNNQSAPGFMHGDDNLYGSVHRVELFDQWPGQVDLAGVVGIMNRSATEDVRSPVWPVISAVLAGGEAPTPEAADAVALLDSWVADDAPLLDGDLDGSYDVAGPVVFDLVFDAVVDAVLQPVLGDVDDAVGLVRFGVGTPSLLDKDLRTVLGRPVEDPYGVAYCGGGDLERCRQSLWDAIDTAVTAEAAIRGPDLIGWLGEADRTGFVPGLIADDFRTTNRPTYQQVLEFAPAG